MHTAIVNSIGMTMVPIDSGAFLMGQESSDPDERPVHRVVISKSFFMAATPVTNAQYERFDPDHRKLRGKHGFSKRDDEAVILVSWHDAVAFCQWLSRKEGKPYCLPTEAQWEYACRAGSTTAYHTGESLPETYHRSQQFTWSPRRVPLTVGKTPPNAWGLYDMHGPVEQWCHDWYGPYESADAVDPAGRASGLFKVTRGGSHNTNVAFLRSANRLGALPDDRSWLIGFRIVQAALPEATPLPAVTPALCMRDVSQDCKDWPQGCHDDKPLFVGPIRYIQEPEKGSRTPFYKNHHCPAITWCPNGDLLAAWFTTNAEIGRELAIIASRLRAGEACWEPASDFFNAPDRNMTGTALFHDGRGTLCHANGVSQAHGWATPIIAVRTSRDNGATWSPATLANAEHQPGNQVIAGMFMTRDGRLVLACDATYKARGGSVLHISNDGGATWTSPSNLAHRPVFRENGTGGVIAGIHAGVAELSDGRLMAMGRANNISSKMPISISEDMGRTWTYHASRFPAISSSQRLVFMPLREGLLLVSFTGPFYSKRHRGMTVIDAAGTKRRIVGMFAAVSFDDGATWPFVRPVTDDGPSREMTTLEGHTFTMSPTSAEPAGYLAATQTPDGMIHLVSSYWHYRFNMAWLTTPMPASVQG